MKQPANASLTNKASSRPDRFPHPLHCVQVWLSLAILFGFGLAVLAAPWLAPVAPRRMDAVQANLKPIWLRPDRSTEGYWLGSDRLGRDNFSRLVYGTRVSIFLAFMAVPLAAVLGILMGIAPAYLGGWVEYLAMRVTDIFSAFPTILFSVLVIMILRNRPLGQFMGGLWTLPIAFSAIGWVSLARLLRGSVLQLKRQTFMEAALALGASHRHMILRHLIPNTLNLVIVWAINTIPVVILLEAGLGYLGVDILNAYDGNEFRVASWGGLFFDGRSKIFYNPFMLLAPTLCVLLISLSFAVIGSSVDRYLNRHEDILM